MPRLPAAQRRTQLVEAAIRVMTRESISRATTRAIAAEAGVSLSVFHYCFSSKRELLESVVETLSRHTVATAAGVLELDESTPLQDVVRAALGAYWQHVVDHPAEHRLTYALTQYSLPRPGLEELAQQQYRGYTQVITELLLPVVDATGAQLPVPVDVLASYLATTLDGLTLQYLVLGDASTADAVLDLVAAHVTALLS